MRVQHNIHVVRRNCGQKNKMMPPQVMNIYMLQNLAVFQPGEDGFDLLPSARDPAVVPGALFVELTLPVVELLWNVTGHEKGQRHEGRVAKIFLPSGIRAWRPDKQTSSTSDAAAGTVQKPIRHVPSHGHKVTTRRNDGV